MKPTSAVTIRSLIAVCFLYTPIWGATYTASVSGPWNACSTWGTCTGSASCSRQWGHYRCNQRRVTVTVTDARIIGTSGAGGTNAINPYLGAIVIAAGGYLTLRGDLVYSTNYGALTTPYLTVQAGGILEFDASQASSPSNTHYRVYNDIPPAARPFIAAGTSSNHAIVRSNAGGGNGYFTLNGNGGGSYITTYTDVVNLGTSSVGRILHATRLCSHDVERDT